MSRIMAIDYGDARVGIALTDPLKIIASGFNTYQNNGNIISTIFSVCKDKEVESIVIGVPFDQDSKVGESALKVLRFAKLLKEHFISNNYDIPFYEQDERYTTHEAYSAMREIKVKRKKKKAIVDQIAAAKILSDFMTSGKKTMINLDVLN